MCADGKRTIALSHQRIIYILILHYKIFNSFNFMLIFQRFNITLQAKNSK